MTDPTLKNFIFQLMSFRQLLIDDIITQLHGMKNDVTEKLSELSKVILSRRARI